MNIDVNTRWKGDTFGKEELDAGIGIRTEENYAAAAS
jgi:hypothetical protein